MKSTSQQRGSVWVIVLVLVAVVIGAWQYSEHKAATRRAVEAQQKMDAERVALEKRLAEEKAKKDVLVTSSKALDAVLARWDDTVKLAGTTGRIALSTPVATLQEIRRDAAALTVPPCMDQAKEKLVASMQGTIDGFIAFMRNDLKMGDVFAQEKFTQAATDFAAFKDGRSSCSQ